MNEDVAYVPPVKPLPLYKCSECSFTTTTTGTLKDHKKSTHEKEKSFKTNDYVNLTEHIDSNHGKDHSGNNHRNGHDETETSEVSTVQSQEVFKCQQDVNVCKFI